MTTESQEQSIEGQISVKKETAESMVSLYPIGSFVYFCNPNYDPGFVAFDDTLSRTRNDAFIVGRVASHQNGTYRVEVFERQSSKSDIIVKSPGAFATTSELALKSASTA